MDLRMSRHLLGPHRGLGAVLIMEVAIGVLLCLMAWQAIDHYRRARADDGGIDAARLLLVAPIGRGTQTPADASGISDVISHVRGVRSVASVNQSPYGVDSWNASIATNARMDRSIIVSVYAGDAALIPTLGARMIEGRMFAHDDVEEWNDVHNRSRTLPVLVTRALAARLYPNGDPIGRPMHGYARTLRIAGVIDQLPQPRGSSAVNAWPPGSIVVPVRPDASWARHLVRIDAGVDANETATRIADALRTRFPDHAIATPTRVSDLHYAALQHERRSAWTLSACALGWWALTLFSLIAASHAWVQQSRIRIGLHRAVGATRAQVRRAVRWDQLQIALAGIALGFVLHRILATQHAALPFAWDIAPVPAWAWVVFAAAIVLLTQALATWPARWAAEVAPDHVTRGHWVRL